jgi:hypothetical protein
MMDMQPLYHLPAVVQTRWASPENLTAGAGAATRGNDGRKRAPFFPLAAGETRTLLELSGTSGTVRRLWVTINDRSPAMLRGLRLDCWWDGAATPAVSAPLGDFFCQGLGRMVAFQSALFSSPEGRSFTCYVPMPFRSGLKATITNESGKDLGMFFYDLDLTVGDAHGPETPWFHAHWRREAPTTAERDFELLPKVTGRGRFLGVNVSVIANSSQWFKAWWGEGEVKAYLDGDTTHPTLCGTGTEDYIGTGWGQGQYAHQYQGCPLADHDRLQYAFYRLHVPDPLYFQREARVTIQQIGCWDPTSILQYRGAGTQLVHGGQPVDMAQAAAARHYGCFERTDDWASCAWFYLDRPANELPPLAPAAERIRGCLAP